MRTIIADSLRYNWKTAGTHSFIYEGELLKKITTRKNVVLKIFFRPIADKMENYIWGHKFEVEDDYGIRDESSNLIEAVKIQNLCAYYGLAGWVYEILIIDFKGFHYPALLVQKLNKSDEPTYEQKEIMLNKIVKLGRDLAFRMKFLDYNAPNNFMEGKLVDFQGVEFEPDYYERMIERYKTNAVFGGNIYQPVLNVEGFRQPDRLKANLKGRNVWDIGCSGGEFCRLAERQGATRILGLDLQSVITSAFEVSNYMGCMNIDWQGRELKRDENIVCDFEPDVIFYLSMQRYLGIPKFLGKAKTLYYEHNGDEPMSDVIKKIEELGFELKENLGPTGWDGRNTLVFNKK